MAASKPTSWLSVHLHFLFHLAYILGPYLAVWALSLLTTNLITRSLTASHVYRHSEFDWAQYPEVGPSHIQCSTFDKLFANAIPKDISGRTSYLQARLEFLP